MKAKGETGAVTEAADALRGLGGAGGGLAEIAAQTGVLMAAAVVLLGLATWRLRVALTR